MGDYWKNLLDNEVKQREDIDAQTEKVSELENVAEGTVRKVERLERQVGALQIMVTTLVDKLAAADHLNETAWRATVEERLRAKPEVAPVPAGMCVCTRCKKPVLPQTTTMTEKGAVCDRWCI